MKKNTTIFSLMAIMAIAASAFAVETTVEGRIYSSWWMNMTDTTRMLDSTSAVDLKGWNQFSLDRSIRNNQIGIERLHQLEYHHRFARLQG